MARNEMAIFTVLVMVENDQGQILVEDRKDPDWPGICFPGGHVEREESFTAAAIRETFEKTGLPNAGNPLNRYDYAHIAFSLGNRQAVDSMTARLKEDGYSVLSGPRTTGDGYYESCILDMEGNQLELTV